MIIRIDGYDVINDENKTLYIDYMDWSLVKEYQNWWEYGQNDTKRLNYLERQLSYLKIDIYKYTWKISKSSIREFKLKQILKKDKTK